MGQFDGTVPGADGQPLRQVGHLGDVAEVRLCSGRHRRDDLVASGGHRVGVTGDLIEQAAAPGRGVVDLMDVGTELAAPGCHAVQRFSGTHPLVGALRVDQHLFDRRRGGGLHAGHRGSADQDAVDRHLRVAVPEPTAGEVFGRPLRRADPAADADGDVRLRTQFGIGVQQGRRDPPRSGGRRPAPSMWAMTGRVGTSAAIRMTDRICSTVPA